MIYLASAHSHFDRAVMAERHESLCYATALLLQRGHCIYSPIVHCYPLAQRFNLRHDFEFWQHYNRAMIDKADEFWVYDDPQGAWEKSIGVTAELEYARQRELPCKSVRVHVLGGTIEFRDLT